MTTLPTDPPPPAQNEGIVVAILNTVKHLTLTQVLIVMLLIAVLAPTYVAWRAINDESMLNTFLSRYEELPTKTSCTVRVFSLRGGGDTYAISTGFAVQGSDRYNISVILGHPPDAAEEVSYCATLDAIVDFMRRPDEAPRPPLIWPYPQ